MFDRFDDSDHELTARLRAGDPAAEGSLSAEEARRMRRRVVAEAASEPVRWPRPIVGVVSAAAALLLAVWLGSRSVPEPLPSRTEPPGPSASMIREAAREARDIRFVTAGGTQVVWRLDPEFNP